MFDEFFKERKKFFSKRPKNSEFKLVDSLEKKGYSWLEK